MGKTKELIKRDVVSVSEDVRDRVISLRGENVILDADVAYLYGVETKRINGAVRNNANKFPKDYMFSLTKSELENLRTKFSSANFSTKSRALPKAFTEKGLYMLATILKSQQAVETTFAIIETFAAVKELKRELVNLHKETDTDIQQAKMKRFGEVLSDVVMPDLETSETESSLELNFIIGKIKHTVKRTKSKV